MASESAITYLVAPKVFLSYSHDSPEHDEEVLGLADRLRRGGIDAAIDQYETAPSKGWVRWMREQIEWANFVLVICTETYQRRAEGKEESGGGLGANREGLIIDQKIYDRGKNDKFIAVLLRSPDSAFVPDFLKPYQPESVETDNGYEALYRRLTQQPAVEKREPGPLVVMPPRERKTDYRQSAVPKTDSRASSRVWNIPASNAFFSGREEYLQTLRNILTKSNVPAALTQAIKGLGGMGKTQTALRYAALYGAEYNAGFLVVADSREILVSGFAEFARLLDLPEKDEKDIAKAAAAAKRWFESNGGWLLILDNVDDWAVAQEWIPASNRGHVLITTRLQFTGTVARGIELPKMTPSEGVKFLLERGKIENVSDADSLAAGSIVEEFDGLPLGLEQAGAYIEEAQVSPAEYLDLYRREGSKLRARRGAIADHDTVTVTFTLAFQKLTEAARQIVQMAAFLAPDAIPEGILSAGKEPDLEFRDAVADGVRFSLIQRNPASRTIDIHRLVQEVVKDSLDQTSQLDWVERCADALNKSFPEKVEFTNWPICEKLLPHARIVAAQILRHSLETTSAARLMHQTAWYLHDRVRYSEAETLSRRALAIREKVLGSDHPDTARSLNNLAALRASQGQYKEAEPLYRRALEINERMLGPDHRDTATSLDNLGGHYLSQGQYKEVEPLYRRALEIRENVLGPDHPDTATILNNLAYLRKSQGQYKEAESLYRRALDIREKVLGPDHPDTATSLNNLAGLHKSQGQYKEAEPLYKRALDINEKVLGPDHPDTAGNLNNLAGLYDSQGQYKEAESLCKRALDITEKVLGPDHPDTARTLSGLASVYRSQRQYKEAEPLMKRALDISERVLGPDHPDTAKSLQNLATFYAQRRRFMEADTLLRRAVAAAERTLGSAHPDTKELVHIHYQVLQGLGRGRDAHKLRERFKEKS